MSPLSPFGPATPADPGSPFVPGANTPRQYVPVQKYLLPDTASVCCWFAVGDTGKSMAMTTHFYVYLLVYLLAVGL